MNDVRYLLDTVSINRLPLDLLNSVFVQSNCNVPLDVCYEVGNLRKQQAVQKIIEKMSADLLHIVQSLLHEIGTNNKVLDIYHNEGNGDVILVATALMKKEQESLTLFKNNWIIVSDDKDLQELAKQKGVKAMSTEAFKQRAINYAQ